jgi:N-acetylmuramoyl-L-alanine amidase
MKKIILLIGFTLLSLSASHAQSLAGYKICINPGHGGHDSDDREIPLGNGVTFWESDGNLSKGLYLKSILENLGAKVIMSRVTNTTADDLPLSQIVAIANSNNVDYFHAIHSNATGTSTKANYTLILFQGRTTIPTYPDALTMANLLAEEIYRSNRTTRKMIAGDFDFYSTGQAYLGVFKGLNMPGTLSEGSFHDYMPEAWRLKNDSYLKNEAYAIARSFLKFFFGGEIKTGIAAGILRDELESVPASYYPISGTKDNFKPVNGVKVTLMPVGKTYTTDSYNNGYYFFDNVEPGNYKLLLESSVMKTDSMNIVVGSNQVVFADKAMILKPILDQPIIINYSPSNNSIGVSNITNVEVEFSIRMNTAETEKAITFSPAVAGSFKWENDYKKAIFTPTKSFIAGTKYSVTVGTAAKSYFGVSLAQESSFNFTTRSQLNLIYTYPTTNAIDISTSVLVSLKFDKGIDVTSLGGKILLTDGNGNNLDLSVKKLGNVDGIIEFEPYVLLENNSTYKVTIKEGIRDVEYVTLPKQTVVEFTTEKYYAYTGNVLDGFESAPVWQSPLLAPNTKGINSSQTSFVLSNLIKKYGNYSGRLDYGFSGTTGSVELAMVNPVTLGESSASEIGMWIYGDNSYNTFEYHFLRANEEKVQIDTLNWTGWKFKKIQLNKIPGSGTIKLKSIVVVQTAKGSLIGKLFFDDCIGNVITDVHSNSIVPSEYSLQQNYPNPFNPSTRIKYSVPVETSRSNAFQKVILQVFDILGREVATLVKEVKLPGSYEVEFNAYGLANGVYIYRLQAGNHTSSKKMILLK